ncbi:hypothetical protein FORC085_4611 [Bacillus cereus]|nr:hypothetical protein FORC085_4611 [Bacillus cereus]
MLHCNEFIRGSNIPQSELIYIPMGRMIR